MQWVLLSSFTKHVRPGWCFRYAPLDALGVKAVPAPYDLDRSREAASAKDWLRYLHHTWLAFRSLGPRRDDRGIITTFPQLAVCACLMKQLTLRRHLPVIAWMFNLKQPYAGVKGWLARKALGSVDRIVVHSRAEIEAYSRWLGLPRERFSFVPLTADIPVVGPWDEDDAAPYVIALGTANRDYATLLRAVRRLGVRTIIVAGDSALQGLEIPPNVEVRSQLPLEACHRLVQRARLHVIPIKNTEAPSGQVTLIEGMMIGCPIVVTRCAGSQDYLAEGREGLMVDPGDDASLEAAIRGLWHDAAERRRLSGAARERGLAQYSSPAAARAMAEMLQQF